ncbi:polysaccharide deacetylase family protein [Natroniella sulfidigena]|uniref:polysaccharide deacetylase family protein n=1 Tax=Natroniella sulfidigena TaxID=723921 RepID=UPI00200B9EBD|nr:polysaccharide deacetylase family protein [Natroniella sulfidigena]MCK8818211.1 polysaccharide deacetylase family protein [Natroniella sulfidigena]
MIQSKNNLIILLAITLLLSIVTIEISYANQTHTIKDGESLFTIARKYDITISTLTSINDLSNQDLIYPGDKLNLPSSNNESSSDSDNNQERTNNNEQDQTEDQAKSSNAETRYSPTSWLSREGSVSAEIKEQEEPKIYYRGADKVALTFDDGPDNKYTPQILDILKEYNVRATFFLVGEAVEKYPHIVERMIEEGHVIGNHSWSHPNLSLLNADTITEEIQKTEEALEQIINRKTTLLRPPYGFASSRVVNQAADSNYRVINWSVDSFDWRVDSKEELLDNTLPGINPGAIVLLHSATGEGNSLAPTVEALPTIIEETREEGLEFDTVDNVLSVGAYRR